MIISEMERDIRQRTGHILAVGNSSEICLFSDDDFSKKKCPPLINSRTWFFIFIVYLSIFIFVMYCDLVRFPSPVSVKSLKTPEKPRGYEFSEERARSFVTELSEIGPKPTGSYENEVVAIDYIYQKLNYIKMQANLANRIDIELQKSSGCFPLDFIDRMTSCYHNVQNVIAKIGPQQVTNKSILINCHFDTAPSSPGASDNIVSCAVMLEVLLTLSRQDQALPNELIFLFNGAEENLHQAAHGFITQHPWAKTAVGFVDMEACGAGGKQMLFQANRYKTWLIEAYADGAPFPLGSVVAQDIFQNGLIPSSTDYPIFEKYGNIPGLDFSYVKNGYVYHSKFDVPEAITEGAIQQAGLNLLNFIHNALRSPNMKSVEDQPNSPLIFFDFLGIFMVVYRISYASAFNVFIIFITFVDILSKGRKSGVLFRKRIVLIGKAFLIMILSLIVAILSCVAIAVLLDIFNGTMSWYRTPFLISGLYGCSSLVAIIAVHYITARNVKSLQLKWVQEDVYFDAARLIWICLLIIMALAGINSSFICCTWLLFPLLIRGILSNVSSLVGSRGTVKSHTIIHISMQIMPLTILLYCFWVIYLVFIPIMGRSGAVINPDILIGVLTSLFVFLATSYMASLIHVMTSPRKLIMLLLFIFVTTFSIVCFTPLGFQYSGNSKAPTPMRLYILQTQRTFHGKNGSNVLEDSGYWIIPLDYNGPRLIKKFIKEMKGVEPIDCEANMACGMPLYIPVQSLFRTTYYIPASKPDIQNTSKFELVSKTALNSNTYRLSFVASGPDHMTVLMSPRPGVVLSKWSLTNDPPLRNLDWNGRPTYFIYYSYGEYTEPWTFSMDLLVNEEYTKGSPLIDLNFLTHYLHGNATISGDLPTFLKQIPSWVDVVSWTSTLDGFIF